MKEKQVYILQKFLKKTYKWRMEKRNRSEYKEASPLIKFRQITKVMRFIKIKFNKLAYKAVFTTGAIILLNCANVNAEPCVGKFVNPITDICWSCMFPLKIGDMTVYSGGREDTKNSSGIPCMCKKKGVPVPGLPVSFWEPARLADVTRTPYCMVGLGGFQMMKTVKKHGSVARKSNDEALKHSFYHVHWYIYPVMYWLEILTDFICLEQASIDVGYMSEFDPLWSNDELNAIINPEAILFANQIAQLACGADCMAATIGFPLDSLFWCAGCNGSLYPFGGFIEHHKSGVESSTLIVERTIARLHRVGLAWDTVSDICKKKVSLKVNKTQYKLQMTFPIPSTKGKLTCNPFGRTTSLWGGGKEIPGNGEDFGYLIWRKKRCCVL
jgi:conjugal transfer pilus assembly protein TraU